MTTPTAEPVPRPAIAAAVILVAAAWVYGPSFHGGWLWDDIDLIARDENLRTVRGLGNLWLSTRFRIIGR